MIKLKEVLLEALNEMPHLEDSEFIDLRIELYPVPQEEKTKLMKAFHLGAGVFAPSVRGNMVFDKNGQRQPKTGEETSLPHLPDDWERYAIRA